jgi:hypothetical protein
MKRFKVIVRYVVEFLLLGILIFALIVVFDTIIPRQQPVSNPPEQILSYPYPLPIGTNPANINSAYPAPLSSHQPPTSDNYLQAMNTEAAKATQFTMNLFPALTATAQAMNSATATPDPSITGYCFTDDDKLFSLQLPPGWHSYGGRGTYTIMNYTEDQLHAGKVDPKQMLWIQIETPMPNSTLTLEELLKMWTDLYKVQPTPYHIGRYDGYQFDLDTKEGGALAIILPIKGGKFLIIGLNPGNSEAINDGLSILSTLDDSATCQNKPGAIG